MTDAPKIRPQSVPPDSIWGLALKEAGVAFVAPRYLAIFYIFAFRWIHPEFVPFMDREATKLIAPGKDLTPISVGGYRVEDNSAIIEDFNGDEAILALTRSFQAEDYPFIKVNLQGFTRYSKFKILWRRAEDPSKTHSLEFNRSGDGVTQIAMVYGNENYRGPVADIALLFYDGPAVGFQNNNNAEIVIHSIEFLPFSVENVAGQISEDWLNPPLWQGYSNNTVKSTHKNGILPPNAVANLLVFTGFLVAFTWRRGLRLKALPPSSPHFIATTLCLCLYGWVFIDILRWHWRLEQGLDSFFRYALRRLLKLK